MNVVLLNPLRKNTFIFWNAYLDKILLKMSIIGFLTPINEYIFHISETKNQFHGNIIQKQ